jgi:hypothetical protein
MLLSETERERRINDFLTRKFTEVDIKTNRLHPTRFLQLIHKARST